jgi:enoyl-CoA hydratase/carnithine racemase
MTTDPLDAAGLEVEWQGDVAILHWRAGDNRFNRTSITGLDAAFDQIEAARAMDQPLAVVVTGDGKFFSNGLDLDWLAGGGDGEDMAGFVDEVHHLFARVLLFPAVVIAAINGHAFAAGAMLATAHDFRVMRTDRGFWCLPEADLGLPLSPAMHAVITGKLPRVTAAEAIMTGRRYDAAQALDAGFVHRTAAEADVVPAAIAWAADLAPKSRATVRRHKEQLNGPIAAVCTAE